MIRVLILFGLFSVINLPLTGCRDSAHNTLSMKSSLSYRAGNGNWVDLKIVNTGDKPVQVFNPGNYPPTEGWEFSRQSYQIAVLQSFQVFKMALQNSAGAELPQKSVVTRADHMTKLPLALKPGDRLVIPIPLHEFYDLKSGETYSLQVSYGTKGSVQKASVQFKVE